MIGKLFSLSFIQVISKIISLLQVILLSKLFDMATLGNYVVLTSMSLIITVGISGGINDYIIATLGKFNRKHFLKMPILITTSLCVVVSLLAMSLYKVRFDLNLIFLIVIIAFFRGISSICVANLTYNKKIYISQIAFSVVPVLLNFIYVWFNYLTSNILTINEFFIYQSFVWLIVLAVLLLLYKSNTRKEEELFKVKLNSYIPYYIFSVVMIINTEGVSLIIDSFVGKEEVAAFRMAYIASTLIPIVLSVATVYVSPIIANNVQNVHILESRLRSIVNVIFIVMLPLIAVSIFLSEFVIRVILGAEYYKSSLLYAVLCLGQICNLYFGIPGVILSISGHAFDMTKVILVSGVGSIIMISFLTYIYGSLGASVGISSSIFFQKFLMSWKCYKTCGVKSWVR